MCHEVCSINVNINAELEKFWKLEMTGIKESPSEDDDDKALQHFKTIWKIPYQTIWKIPVLICPSNYQSILEIFVLNAPLLK
ncbi:unnamed protein product [Wuchereria bancrofti]|uniref:Uncharacterized protein n=1 Tax=Wuchereria bancrofti TaxID=6293 RepID=A0A3P7FSB8_WUCBA|nr:unnamed protein product [Wuchereria bancrofti]